MYKYVIKRLLMIIPVVLIVSFSVYVIMGLVPGDVAVAVLGDEATPEQLERFREERGLNDPILIQYFRYISGIVRMDLGTSVYNNIDVWHIFFDRLPNTLILAGAAVFFAILVSIPLGMWAAIKQNTWVDTTASVTSFFGISMPNFWVGLLLIVLFSVNLGWLPAQSMVVTPASLILPAITLGTGLMGAITRTTRSAMLDVIHSDYLRTARSKGLQENRVINKHALGNAWIPIVTMVGTQVATLMGGSVITERVFSWPGIGSYLIDSILRNDYPVVTGFVIMISVLVSLVLLIVDVMYAFIDPRIKAQYANTKG
jgi:peptide/nickel transport system permease protein